MSKPRHEIRSAGTAIAAVLALTSTPLLAQDATLPSEPEPAAVSAPAEPAASEPAPVAAPTETVTSTTTTTSSSSIASPEASKPVRSVNRSAASVPARAAAKPAAVASAPAASPASAEPAAGGEALAAPVAVAEPAPEPAAPAPTAGSSLGDDASELAFGGALAALGIAGLALAATRRRRRREASHAEAEPAVIEPIERAVYEPTPDRPERSAFAWGAVPAAPAVASSRLTPTAQAKLGPTPDNPSLSLKRRLKRAAFFEQRERDAAAGRAVPVARAAGLPSRAVEALRRQTAQFSTPQFQPA